MWKWILGGAAAYLVLKKLGGSTVSLNALDSQAVANIKATLAKNYGTSADKIEVVKLTNGQWQATYNGQVVAGPAATLNDLSVASGADQTLLIQQTLAYARGTTADKIVIQQTGSGYQATYDGQVIATGATLAELAIASGLSYY